MNLNEYVLKLQELQAAGHGELPVILYEEDAEHEVTKAPVVQEGVHYEAPNDNRWSYHVGTVVALNYC